MTEETLFHLALEKSPDERGAFLDDACAGDAELRERVEVLLRAHEASGSFLDRPPFAGAAALGKTSDQSVLPPQHPESAGEAATQASAVPASASSALGTQVRYFGDYELLEEIARGGMGVVYKARQVSLNRVVAVKMILAGQLATQADHDRFHAEAQAAAQLDHPNIVPVFEVGEYQGQHYFSMGHVDGGSLLARLAEGPLPPKDAAELAATVAEAVEYAHRQGVIHRDIKPSNVLIDSSGRPRVTDFGLAKRVGAPGGNPLVGAGRGSDLTAPGQILGTPGYMAPEQAVGQINAVGPAADVYALGALLYSTLTGRPPFQAATALETMHQVLEREPVSPSQLNPAVPKDLETIALKCLEKSVPRRYATAQALADDLQRYLEGRPILARPVGRWEHARRWCRRNPVVAGLIAAVALTLVAGGLISSMFAIKAFKERDRANGNAVAQAEARRRAEQSEQQTAAALALTRRSLWISRLAQSQGLHRAHNTLLAQEILDECPIDLRNWEWRYLKRLYTGGDFTLYAHEGNVRCVVYSPDGQRIASGGTDGVVKIWNAATGEKLRTVPTRSKCVNSVAFGSDGVVWAACTNPDTIQSWDASTGRELHTLPWPGLNGLALSPDRKRLAAFGNNVTVLDVASGRELLTFKGHSGFVACACFSPDGHRVASGSTLRHGAEAKIWDAASGQVQFTLELDILSAQWVTSASFSPDGKQLAVASFCGVVTVYDAVTGKEIFQHAGPPPEKYDQHRTVLKSIAFSPNEPLLAASGYGRASLALWNPPSSPDAISLMGGFVQVNQVAFSPDGRRLAAARNDGTIKIWSVHQLEQALTFRLTPQPSEPISFMPRGELIRGGDGRRVGVCERDGTLRVWDPRNAEKAYELKEVIDARFSFDGNRLATVSVQGKVAVRDALLGCDILPLELSDVSAVSICFSADGQRLAAGSRGGRITIWDLSSGSVSHSLSVGTASILDAAFSPDGRRLVGCDADGTITIWEAHTGERLSTFPLGTSGKVALNFGQVLFSSDGRRLAVHFQTKGPKEEFRQPVLMIWDTDQAQEVFRREGNLNFDPDIRYVAIIEGPQNYWVTVWDVTARRELFTLKGHSAEVHTTAFSADGQRLATGCGQWTFGNRPLDIRLWDVQTGAETLTLESPSTDAQQIAISPRGDYMLVLGNSTMTVWNARPCQKVRSLFWQRPPSHPEQGGASFACLAFSPTGQQLAAGDAAGFVTVWNLATGQVDWWLGKLEDRGVSNVTFSSDGRRMGARYPDGSILAWDLVTGEKTQTAGLSFGADGQTLIDSPDHLWAAAAFAKFLHVWDTHLTEEDRAYRIALARSPYHPPLPAAEKK